MGLHSIYKWNNSSIEKLLQRNFNVLVTKIMWFQINEVVSLRLCEKSERSTNTQSIQELTNEPLLIS